MNKTFFLALVLACCGSADAGVEDEMGNPLRPVVPPAGSFRGGAHYAGQARTLALQSAAYASPNPVTAPWPQTFDLALATAGVPTTTANRPIITRLKNPVPPGFLLDHIVALPGNAAGSVAGGALYSIEVDESGIPWLQLVPGAHGFMQQVDASIDIALSSPIELDPSKHYALATVVDTAGALLAGAWRVTQVNADFGYQYTSDVTSATGWPTRMGLLETSSDRSGFGQPIWGAIVPKQQRYNDQLYLY